MATKAGPKPVEAPAQNAARSAGIAPDEWRRGPLCQRLLWVQASLPRMAKDSVVSTGGGGSFKAVSHDAVVSAAKPLLVQAGILVVAHPVSHQHELVVVQGSRGDYTAREHAVELEVTWINVDDPQDRMVQRAFGFGLDTSDKGYGKAISYGKKYGLLLTLLGETGEDVDQGEAIDGRQRRQRPRSTNDAASAPQPTLPTEPHEDAYDIPERAWRWIVSEWHSHGVVSEKQVKRLFALAIKAGWTSEQVTEIIEHHLGVKVTELPFGKPYDGVVRALSSYGPKSQGAEPEDESQDVGADDDVDPDLGF